MTAFPLDSRLGLAMLAPVSRATNILGLLVVILAVGGLYLLLPLGTAVQFGGDEGYELMTGFLIQKGYVLYGQIWNDQPPLLVLLLSWAFKAFGPSILVARLLAAAFGLSLFAAFYWLVCQRHGVWAALTATFLLLASPAVLEISVSVMQEVPAFALALTSVLLLFRWCKSFHWGWLVGSGALMAAALEIKFTAALTVPALLIEILVTLQKKKGAAWLKQGVVPVLEWVAALGIVFAIISLTWGRGSFQSSYRAHFTAHLNSDMGRPEDFPVPITVFIGHAECVVSAIIGILLIFRQHRIREFSFPLVLLITAICVHAIHRPWWMYYYLHMAIPMSWIGGFAVVRLIREFSKALAANAFKLSLPVTWKSLFLCLLAALAFERSERRLEAGMENLRGRKRIATDPILAKMKEYAPHTRWVYVHYGNEVYPFHAGLSMPPELALVTLKRFWSGQISDEKIVETCRRYEVDQLLLTSERTQRLSGLAEDYVQVSASDNLILLVAKRISHE